ncbi:MAG: hypothetical protein NE327_15825, partial [Lentisphaeraceae bacterium]|nr:hypothetical protein [Lentisphaeraceae bacterium]
MKRFLCFSLLVLLSQSAFSWTASHKRLAKELEYLVPYIKEKLNLAQRQQLNETYCLAPDYKQPLPSTIIGAEAVEYLKSVRVFSTIQFSDINTVPHMYYLLVEAMKRRKYDAVAYWTGCISHVFNDAASPHQVPSIYFYQNIAKLFESTTPDGKKILDVETSGLYVDRLFNLPEGMEILKKLRTEYKPASVGTKPGEVSEYLTALNVHLRNASFKHSEYLVDNIERCIYSDKPLVHNGILAVSKMGVIGISAAADVLNSAWSIAQNKTKYKSDDILDDISDSKLDALLAKRTLIQMPLFRDVYSSPQAGIIGVLAEPYYTHKQGALGYTSRYLAANIMGSLKAQKITYRSINLLNALKKGVPSAKEMPILIVPACNLSSGYRWIKKRDIMNTLQKYTAEGGRVIWIGSDRATFLGDMSFNLKNIRNSSTYTEEVLKEGYVHFSASLSSKGEDDEIKGIKTKKFPIKHVPKAGFEWSDLKSVLEITDSEKLENIIYFKDDNDTVKTVGSYWPHLST